MPKNSKNKIVNKIKQSILWKNFSSLRSVYIISSIARGDFIESKSDIDLLLIFEDTTCMDEMQDISNIVTGQLSSQGVGHRKTSQHHDSIDILYLHIKDIPMSQTAAQQSPFPLLSIFGFDLKQSNIIIYGENVLDKFTPAEPKFLIKKYLVIWIEKAEELPKDATLFAGQSLRVFAIKSGATSLTKKHVLGVIKNSNLPQWVKEYALIHHVFCYESSPFTTADMHEKSRTFLQRIKKDLH